MNATSQQCLNTQILSELAAFHLLPRFYSPSPGERTPELPQAAHRQQKCHFALHVTVLLNFRALPTFSNCNT